MEKRNEVLSQRLVAATTNQGISPADQLPTLSIGVSPPPGPSPGPPPGPPAQESPRPGVSLRGSIINELKALFDKQKLANRR